jgi:flagellar biosynthesis/type III secretory pathway protein FliH
MSPVLKRPAEARGSLRLSAPFVSRSPLATHAAADKPHQQPVPMRAAAAVAPLPAVDLQALREEAIREGLAQGRQAAEKELRAALERQADQWRSGLKEMQVALEQHLRGMERSAVAIAFEALGNVLGHAYVHGEALAAAVRQLLQRSPATAELTVVVAPHTMEALQRSLSRETGSVLQHIRLQADPTLPLSACRVVNERGVLETDLKIQLQAILDALLQAHRAVIGDAR